MKDLIEVGSSERGVVLYDSRWCTVIYIYGLSAVESTGIKLSGVDFRTNNRDKRVTTTISGRIYPALFTVDLYAL